MHQRQQRALSALLASPTIAEAARAAGLSERTMYRYLDDAEFAEAYKDAMKRVTDETATRLIRSMGPAVQTLEEVCQDGRASPHARVQAANSILSHALRAIDRRTLEMSGPVPTFVFEPDERGGAALDRARRLLAGVPSVIDEETRAEVARLLELDDDERTDDEQEEG